MHGERVDAMRVQLVLLVLHQRDERADDDGEARERQRGELVDDRLAAAGGHDDEGVAAGEHGAHRLPLAPTKIRMTKAVA